MRLGRSEPKCLTPVAGRPLLAWIVDALARAGVERVYAVVSAEFPNRDKLAAQFSIELEVRAVQCPDSQLGNGRSAAFAQTLVHDERFLLLMGDHLVSAEHLQLVAAAAEGACALGTCAPASWIDIQDATKVLADAGGSILEIGKHLTSYNQIDTGVFAMTHALFPALEEARRAQEYSLTAGNRRLARTGLLRAVSVGSLRWCDVDTPHDLAAAEAWLGGLPRDARVG
jgi:choline kinase